MDELLALKWNNHASSYLHSLSTLRTTNKYSDVTIVCEGKFYKVHQVVLSMCSDYFSCIFDQVSGNNIVIILTDVSCDDFEKLLDYMYLGETNFHQDELNCLFKAANYLKMKGFLTMEKDNHKMCKRISNNNSGSQRKRRKIMENIEVSYPSDSADEDNVLDNQDYNVKPHLLEEGGEPSYAQNSNIVKSLKHLQNTCTVCAKSFGKRYDLDRHMRIHTGQKPYQCLYCMFRGRQKSHVINHILSVHQDICGSSSVTTSDLTESQPIMSIDGSEEIEAIDPSRICGFCGKVFRDKNKCQRHTLIHTNEKTHFCIQCSFRTNSKDYLSRHISRKHESDA